MLLLLRERATHGYDLLEQLPDLVGAQRIDVGNVYRVLRAMEEDGLVTSEWSDERPGPAKRSYELTADGCAALDRWAESLREARAHIDSFLERYEERR